MNFLFNIRIRSRLLLLLAFSLAALLALGAFSSLTIQRETDRATAFIDGEFEAVQAVSEVRAAIGNARRYEKDVFLNMGDEKETLRYTDLWKAEIAVIRGAITRGLTLASPSEAAMLEGMLKGIDGYDKGFRGILGQLERGELNDPWAANKAMTPLKADIRQADKALADLSVSISTRAVEQRKALAVTGNQAPWLVAGATVGVSVLATLLVLAIIHSIVSPIKHLQDTADAWGNGDLTAHLQAGGRDEIGDVQRDLGSMHTALVRLVSEVQSGVDIVRNNTAEITHANGDLSARTEHAADSLQQATASIDQLSVAVEHTAGSALQAVRTAAQAMQDAQRGGHVVAEVVHTMKDINTSSHKIADIISVIDGIAFQTNILALNAAVEAARAGEQGRGFAVVASEVRSLAGRSAEAAREIRAIIVSSVEKVEQGSALVETAGQTMREIVSSVGNVSTVIEAIRVAANEQVEGIRAISAAMGGLDQSTQQNAAMVQESAAGARGLSAEADQLHAAVSVFRLTSGSGVGRGPFAVLPAHG
ncbi:HAMP domain-containing protein [Rhodoferax sp. AJA081-3]|uniref:methyl-accepting chemotaxis protein n=1 Tax=Rhodoferax sp. AJA081-3 TaxID=2752316 RepID=UPI001AE04E35|nr:methyl-accepting chemotaxis protein [Rhodoferax sp. AJA081-3]QTN28434.1 HAMP domain-containing protein [Rhodoferax sp. AJA081-3]